MLVGDVSLDAINSVDYPKRFEDDGDEVVVDVHGCSIDGALTIIRRTVQEAARRGRSRVVVIHGRSRADRPRTIRGELMRVLERGEFDAWVTSSMQAAGGGQSVLYMPIGVQKRPDRIRQQDVVSSW